MLLNALHTKFLLLLIVENPVVMHGPDHHTERLERVCEAVPTPRAPGDDAPVQTASVWAVDVPTIRVGLVAGLEPKPRLAEVGAVHLGRGVIVLILWAKKEKYS